MSLNIQSVSELPNGDIVVSYIKTFDEPVTISIPQHCSCPDKPISQETWRDALARADCPLHGAATLRPATPDRVSFNFYGSSGHAKGWGYRGF